MIFKVVGKEGIQKKKEKFILNLTAKNSDFWSPVFLIRNFSVMVRDFLWLNVAMITLKKKKILFVKNFSSLQLCYGVAIHLHGIKRKQDIF